MLSIREELEVVTYTLSPVVDLVVAAESRPIDLNCVYSYNH